MSKKNKTSKCTFFKFFLFFLFCSITPAISACNPGCFDNGIDCEPCLTGTYSENGDTCISCPNGKTGNITVGSTYCVNYINLKSSTNASVILRANKNTTPNLCIETNSGDKYYADLSSILTGKFKIIHNSTAYSVVEPAGKLASECGIPDRGFQVTLQGMFTNNTFSFEISSQGNFQVDWGDGTAIQQINKANTTKTTYSHTYTFSGGGTKDYIVTLTGQATGHSSGIMAPAISFENSFSRSKIVAITGDLGAIFPILGNPVGSTIGSPQFYQTFYGCSGLTKIPDNLFAGLNGPPLTFMFYGTFQNCTGLTKIPADLFASVKGAPANGMFYATFQGCTGLKGEIPGSLFAGIKGAPISWMFGLTFSGCSGLTSIGDGLFDGISGAMASYAFTSTFDGCANLTGPSATTKGSNGIRKPLYQEWPSALTGQVGNCYTGANKLTDWGSIPAAWK